MGTKTMGSEGGAFQDPRTHSLPHQGSQYNLTLDEVQNQLGDSGKPLGSMNPDELLKSVWTAEVGGIDNVSSQSSQPAPSPAGLTMPSDLSKKTVGRERPHTSQEKSPTFGDATLEAFLMKAGVPSNNGTEHASEQAQWIHQQNMMAVPVFDTKFSKRVSSSGGVVEKTVERRQKRMIKNRESASRSRARKQAYTHELENKVSLLEQENQRLRTQQEIEKELPSAPPEPKAQLRRTSSSSF